MKWWAQQCVIWRFENAPWNVNTKKPMWVELHINSQHRPDHILQPRPIKKPLFTENGKHYPGNRHNLMDEWNRKLFPLGVIFAVVYIMSFFVGSLFYESFLSGAPTRLKLHCALYQLIKLYRSKGRGFQMQEWKQFLPERYLSRGDTELRFSQQQKNRLQTSRVARTRARTQTSRAGAGYARTQSCNAFIFEC